jgi:hypothetical protein
MLQKKWLILGILIVLSVGVVGVWLKAPPGVGADEGIPPFVELPWETPPDYHIIYFLAAGSVERDSYASPERLETTLSAQTIYDWNDVVLLDAAQPIDALILHDSALSQVNQEWVASAYERGVVIAALNIYAPELAVWINDPCITRDGFASEPYPGDFFVIVFHRIFGHPDEIEQIETAYRLSCGEESPEGITQPGSIRGGAATNSLSSLSDHNLFAMLLVDKIENLKQESKYFENVINSQESVP